MIPLCTTTNGPERCGWAFSSLGRPWVAQRVWPMPRVPGTPAGPMAASSAAILPTLRRTAISPPSRMATPAES